MSFAQVETEHDIFKQRARHDLLSNRNSVGIMLMILFPDPQIQL